MGGILTKHRSGGEIDPTIAKQVIRPFVESVCIRMTSADRITIGTGDDAKQIQVGGGIPPMETKTLELDMDYGQKFLYVKALKATNDEIEMSSEPEVDYDPSDANPDMDCKVRLSMKLHRRFIGMAAHPMLDPLERDFGLEDVFEKFRPGQDSARMSPMEVLYQRMNMTTNPSARFHADRTTQLATFCDGSAKMCALIFMMNEVIVKGGRRLAVFVDWPITQWLVESVVAATGLKALAIRADQRHSTREEVINAFNEADNGVHMVICSTRVGGQGLNLQKQCSDLVLVDHPRQMNTIQQTLYRVCRMGQTRCTKGYILTLNKSYDSRQRMWCSRKYFPIMSVLMSDAEIDRECRLHRERFVALHGEVNANEKLFNRFNSLLRDVVRHRYTCDYIQSLQGARSSAFPKAWGLFLTPYVKDFLPGECLEKTDGKKRPVLSEVLDRVLNGDIPSEDEWASKCRNPTLANIEF